MPFIRSEMGRAETYTKSCMFKQMLARDWDAKKVTDVSEENNRQRGDILSKKKGQNVGPLRHVFLALTIINGLEGMHFGHDFKVTSETISIGILLLLR